jgi:ABC-type lipopolysaccharide export system ATPase subunit
VVKGVSLDVASSEIVAQAQRRGKKHTFYMTVG